MPPSKQQNIFSKPLPVNRIDKGSKVAVCIELLADKEDGSTTKIGTGTGFFHKFDSKWCLVTNWHVVTGRDPANPSRTINGYPCSPSKFRFFVNYPGQPKKYVSTPDFPLYENQTPVWIEFEDDAKINNRRIDLVAIPFVFTEEKMPLITPIANFAHDGIESLRMGRELTIIGYPFGLQASSPYPIWKRGYLASEPSIALDGMPKFYLDSPGRPGMSGAPVFTISPGFDAPAELARKLKEGSDSATQAFMELDTSMMRNTINVLEFVGVYSGSIGDVSLEKLQLGIVWHGGLVDMLFEKARQGTNPYPPVFY